jgi:quercetin dioxygenase-like cupin family protein
MVGIEVISETRLEAGDSTPGIVRKVGFRHDGIAVGQSTIAPRNVSSWHHHGTRPLYGILVDGHLRFDYGPGGRASIVLGRGDYFYIPTGLVHRDVNPDTEIAAVVASVLLGQGPGLVNVPGPEP